MKAKDDRSDGELLTAYLNAHDEVAFEHLVERYHQRLLVYCRYQLLDPVEAEDVCQTVFLVLSHSAKALRKRKSAGHWLYGVARHTCQRVNREGAARQRRLGRFQNQPTDASINDASTRCHERIAVLRGAMETLSEKERFPLTLHYLNGYTFLEIGRLLNCKPSTISMRISRGREKLRKSLARQGVVLSVAGTFSLLTQDLWTKAPSSTFVQTCSQAAMALVEKGSCADMVGANVQTLMKGVLHMMYLKKLKMVVAAFVALAVLAGGVAVVAPESANQVAAEISGRVEVGSIPAPYDKFVVPVINKYASPGDQIKIYKTTKTVDWAGLPPLYKVDYEVFITNASGKRIYVHAIFNHWMGTVKLKVYDYTNWPMTYLEGFTAKF